MRTSFLLLILMIAAVASGNHAQDKPATPTATTSATAVDPHTASPVAMPASARSHEELMIAEEWCLRELRQLDSEVDLRMEAYQSAQQAVSQVRKALGTQRDTLELRQILKDVEDQQRRSGSDLERAIQQRDHLRRLYHSFRSLERAEQGLAETEV